MPLRVRSFAGLGPRVRLCCRPRHLRRTLYIAAVVGSWLTLFNQGEVLWAGEAGFAMLLKVFLNYLTPFAVANLGLLSAEREDETITSTGSENPRPTGDEREGR